MISGSISKLLGRSPISFLQKHMAIANDCTQLLSSFFDAALAGNWQTAGLVQQQMVELEQAADDIKKDVRLHLPNSLFLPVARSDVLELLSAQDRVANRAKDIAGLVLGRQMRFPAEIINELKKFLQRVLDAAAQAAKAISELDELLETSFRGSEAEIVENMIVELSLIENDTDKMQREIRHSLFTIEKNFHPVEVVFWYKIIEWIGDLADRANHIGSRLQLMLAS